MPTFDYNYQSTVDLVFSIPYFVCAALIGLRRGSHIKLSDFYFLALGDFVIVTLLWRVFPHFGK